MTRVGVRQALYLGTRTLLVMTCRRCGQLKPANEYGTRRCKGGEYIDRRCRPCRWRVFEASPGR